MVWLAKSKTEAGSQSTSRRRSILERLPGIRRNIQAFNANRETVEAEGSGAKADEKDIPSTEAEGSSAKADDKEIATAEEPTAPQVNLPVMNVTGGIDFAPPVIFGDVEEEGLSAIQRADLYIEKWEKMRECHEQHYPAALPVIDQTLERGRAHRAALEDNEENNRVGDPMKREQVVLDRIALLETELENAQFLPEIENIRGAIAAYRSGEIPYSNQYTLIWGGKVVDRADSYAEFTVDRQERLDRYADLYGGHWLWWESPLKLKPHERPRLNLCTELKRFDIPSGLGGFYIGQTFWKRAGWVRRTEQVVGMMHHLQHRQSPLNRVDCQDEGPKITYRTIVDSGATLPSLHPHDFLEIGIDLYNYGAQSIETMETVNGPSRGRVYELFVSIVDDNGESLVDPAHPVWPSQGKYLGGLCPVFMLGCGGPEAIPTDIDAEGFTRCARLSGVLPFLCCYTSTTPSWNTMYMGEDRNDVMGGHKTPGQRRWEIGMPNDPPDPKAWEKFGNPLITFNHRDGEIINEDMPNERNRSQTIFFKGQPNEQVVVWNPAEESMRLAMQRRRQEQEAERNMPTNLGRMAL